MPTAKPPESERNGDRGWLAALGLMMLPVLCCGLPLLIAAGSLGAVGSVLRNPYIVAAAFLVLLGLAAWAIHRRVARRGCQKDGQPRTGTPGSEAGREC